MKWGISRFIGIVLAAMATLGAGIAREGPAESQVSATNEVASPSRLQAAELRLNFRNAPLDSVLEYLSDAAGFIINKEATLRGTVDVWSKDPITPAEAVDLLNSALRKNGYAVTRSGRILTVIELDNAKTADLEVVVGSNPEEVTKSEEVVTQVIPVRHANAAQLVNNLQVLLPSTASLSANESANTLILVSTRSHIKRMLKIIKSLDTALASVSSVRVFPLKYAEAAQMATVVQQLFAPQTSTQRGASGNPAFTFGPGGFPGAPGFPGGSPAFPGAGEQSQQGGRGGGSATAAPNAAATRVVAVAEETSNSLVVSANQDLLPVIADIVAKLDVPVSDVVELRLFRLRNADPTELADQLASLFPDESRNADGRDRQSFRFGLGPFGGAFSAQTANSERTRRQNRVVAVPDSRTSSLLVSAGAALMPQIAEMIAQLDSSAARKETVAVFQLNNASPEQVNQVLLDLFNRNNAMRNNSNGSSQRGEEDALLTRQTQQQQQQLNQSRAGGFRGGSGADGAAMGGGTQP